MPHFLEFDVESATVQVKMKDGRVFTFEVEEPWKTEVDIGDYPMDEPSATPTIVGRRDFRLMIKPGREPIQLKVTKL